MRNLRGILFGLAVIVLSLSAVANKAHALDRCEVPHGATYNIDEHSTCRAVTNNHASGQTIMVPTKTAAEWSTGANAFLNALPPGVVTAACTCGGAGNWSIPVVGPTLNNPTPAANDYFGWSVGVSGNTVVIGAAQDDTGATNAGSAYIYNASTGALMATINNPTPAASDGFGYSVDASGDKVVIGSRKDDIGATDAGAAYVYNATTGALIATLSNPTPVTDDDFYTVAIDGNTVVVGADEDDTGATNAGSVYIFDATTGALLRTINNPTPVANDNFGMSVDVSGNTVVIGADRDDTGATDAGSAYIYNATTGVLVATLNNPTPAASDGFGRVAIEGNTVVVGAIRDDTGATDAGSAYIYNATTGALVATINNPTPVSTDFFGGSVAVSSSTVVVGAYFDDTGATNAGSVYFYNATTGALLATLNNPTPAASEGFGYSVAVDNNKAVAGAYGDGTGASGAGSAYIYTSTGGGPCTSCAP